MLLTRCSTIYGHGCAIQDGPIRFPASAGDKALSWTGCGAPCPTGPMSLIDARSINAATETPKVPPGDLVAYLEKLPSIAWPYNCADPRGLEQTPDSQLN
jgi:hypothetical protein